MKSNNHWPTGDERSIEKFFGEVGTNQTYLRLPYPMKLAWNTSVRVTRTTCHKKVKESLSEVLEEVLRTYGHKDIERLGLNLYGGCFNVRKMRGSSRMSKHSWGIAIDIYPSKNGLRTPFKEAEFSKLEYKPFINSFIKEGWEPLGLTIGKDSMHFQATDNSEPLVQRHDKRFRSTFA